MKAYHFHGFPGLFYGVTIWRTLISFKCEMKTVLSFLPLSKVLEYARWTPLFQKKFRRSRHGFQRCPIPFFFSQRWVPNSPFGLFRDPGFLVLFDLLTLLWLLTLVHRLVAGFSGVFFFFLVLPFPRIVHGKDVCFFFPQRSWLTYHSDASKPIFLLASSPPLIATQTILP